MTDAVEAAPQCPKPRHVVARVVVQEPVDPKMQPVSAVLTFPNDGLEEGPQGSRVHVIDYDASTRQLYAPAPVTHLLDPVRPPRPLSRRALRERAVHTEHVYALVMHTLGVFEAALGRRVDWGFDAHQIKIVPHAFNMANAFYSRETEAILFGYFERERDIVHTCLSHDIVVHETTHALLDGLRKRFMVPSSPDQAAFHEAFADIVALLSTFTFPGVVGRLLDRVDSDHRARISKDLVTADGLRESVLFGLADAFLDPDRDGRSRALRRSVLLPPGTRYLSGRPGFEEYEEPHRRAEVLVAAVMNAFIEVWARRLLVFAVDRDGRIDRERATEEGVDIAQLLMRMSIRAIDYTPPVHLTFSDFLTAALTADTEVRPDDEDYQLRRTLRTACAAYGIHPVPQATEAGLWKRSPVELDHEGVRFAALRSDPVEMFRLIWNNRENPDLRLGVDAYTRVTSLRPSVRFGAEDGQLVHETVAECTQYVRVRAADLPAIGFRRPDDMPDDTEVPIEGGSTFVLDEYARLKYEISNRLPDPNDPKDDDRRARVQQRIDYLWRQGFYEPGRSFASRLSTLHRGGDPARDGHRKETW